MVDYLSGYTSSEAPHTSRYDATFTVAKINMTNNALNPQKEKLRSTKNRKNTEVMYSRRKQKPIEGESSRYYISANGSDILSEYANKTASSVPAEGGKSCQKLIAIGYQDICIMRNICTNGKQKIKFRSQLLDSSYQNSRFFPTIKIFTATSILQSFFPFKSS